MPLRQHLHLGVSLVGGLIWKVQPERLNLKARKSPGPLILLVLAQFRIMLDQTTIFSIKLWQTQKLYSMYYIEVLVLSFVVVVRSV